MDERDWDLVLNTNLTSAYRCIKQVLPYMLAQQSGSIHQYGFNSGTQIMA